MDVPFIVWSLIAGVFVVILLAHLFRATVSHKPHFIQIGKEREEFFIPGDSLHEDDYNEDE